MDNTIINFNKISDEGMKEELDSAVTDKNHNVWKKISKFAFLAFIFLLPVWILPWTIFPLEMNKAYLTFIFTALIAIFWLINFIQTEEIKIPKSIILFSFIIIAAIWLVSAIFSENRQLSLIGEGYNLDSFSTIMIWAFLAFLTAFSFQNETWSLRFFYAFFASAITLFIFQFFRSVLNITLLPFGSIFPAKTSNLFGTWNELGIFFGLTALQSVIFLQFFKKRKVFFGTILALSLVAVIGINFGIVWTVLAVFLMILTVYLFSVSKEKRPIAGLPLAVFIIAVLFIFLKPLMADLLTEAGLNYIEVKPSWSSTFDIVKNVLKSNPILGTGPGTFVYNWLAFKSQSVNLTPFWAARFNYGVGIIPSLSASAGILGILAWLGFFVLFLIQFFKILNFENGAKSQDVENDKSKSLAMASFFGAVYLWIFNIIYVSTFVLFGLAFIFTGLFIAQMARTRKIKTWDVNFMLGPKLRFISSLFILVIIIAVTGAFYVFSKKYIASYYFVKGTSVVNIEGNIEKAENYFLRAANYDAQDRYYRGLTEIRLLKLNRIFNNTELPADELRVNFQNTLSSAIQSAQSAVQINKLDPLNWAALARVYESVIPLKIEGASELSLNGYDNAIKRDPVNPDYFIAKARVLLQTNKTDEAKNALKEAINLKGDYATPNFILAQIEAVSGNLAEAIKRARDAQFLAPNDIGIAFQLGLLYYQNQDYENAKQVFKRTVVLNENYSNARYFLGLIYDREGDKEKAIEEFKKIEILNPDNQEVKKILDNLKNGKPALEKIAPPAPQPEQRETPPVEPKK